MSADFLSAEWLSKALENASQLPKSAGSNLKISFEINKLPKTHESAGKKVRFFAVLADGKLKKLEPGSLEDAQIAVRSEYKSALGIARGELNPEVAYMQGLVKLDGKYEQLLFGLRDFFASKGWTSYWQKIQSSL